MAVNTVNTGTISAGGTLAAQDDAVLVELNNCRWVAVQLIGDFTATVTFEGTIDQLTWRSLGLGTVAAQGTIVTTATAAGIWLVRCGGLAAMRARCSAFTSGPLDVALNVGR